MLFEQPPPEKEYGESSAREAGEGNGGISRKWAGVGVAPSRRANGQPERSNVRHLGGCEVLEDELSDHTSEHRTDEGAGEGKKYRHASGFTGTRRVGNAWNADVHASATRRVMIEQRASLIQQER